MIAIVPTADRGKATVKVRVGARAERRAHRARHGRARLVPRPEGRRPPRRAPKGVLVPPAAIVAARRAERRLRRRATARRSQRVVKPAAQDVGAMKLAARRREGRRARGSVAAARAAGRREVNRGRAEPARSAQSQAGDDMAKLIEIRDLSKVYERGKQKVEVLHHIDLDVEQGDFLALMGPSGSGKTTLLNLIGGLDVPSGGSITRRRPAHRPARRRRAREVARRQGRLRLPVLQPDADALGAEERRAAAAADQAVGGRAQEARGDRAAARRPGRPRRAQADRALGRPAAARLDRAGDRLRPDAAGLRRADRRPRPAVGRGRAGPAAGAQPRPRQDDRDGHPRPEGRRVREPHAASGQGHAGRERARGRCGPA